VVIVCRWDINIEIVLQESTRNLKQNVAMIQFTNEIHIPFNIKSIPILAGNTLENITIPAHYIVVVWVSVPTTQNKTKKMWMAEPLPCINLILAYILVQNYKFLDKIPIHLFNFNNYLVTLSFNQKLVKFSHIMNVNNTANMNFTIIKPIQIIEQKIEEIINKTQLSEENKCGWVKTEVYIQTLV
jgi:hypothetical protein